MANAKTLLKEYEPVAKRINDLVKATETPSKNLTIIAEKLDNNIKVLKEYISTNEDPDHPFANSFVDACRVPLKQAETLLANQIQ